jgi:hypothetical protein
MREMIDDIGLARAPHVLFVAHWIGVVVFVTVAAPPLARSKGEAKAGGALSEAADARTSKEPKGRLSSPGHQRCRRCAQPRRRS